MATLGRRDFTSPSTSNTASYVSSSFTPSADDLLVVWVAASATVTAVPTLTASANGLTFTLVDAQFSTVSAGLAFYKFIANEKVPGSPALMTITVDFGGDAATGRHMAVIGVTGMSRVGLDAVRQYVGDDQNHTAGTVPSVTFPAACLTENPVIAGGVNLTNSSSTLVEPSGFTEIYDAGYSTPTTGMEIAVRASGHTSDTVTAGGTMTGGLYAAMELDTSEPSEPPPSEDGYWGIRL